MDFERLWAFFNWKKVLLPIVIGLGFTVYFIADDFSLTAFKSVDIGGWFFLFIGLAILFSVMRDLGYMFRIMLLSGHRLSLKRAFQVIMLWEFASAITPSVVGGSAVAAFILNAEKIKLGRATSIVMVTAFLDELFYVLAVPVVMLLIGLPALFNISSNFSLFGVTLHITSIFIIGYSFMLLLISIISYAIFIRPRSFRAGILRLFRWRRLSRWFDKANGFTGDLLLTSEEFRGRGVFYWVKAFGYTVFSWMSRFLVVNMLILAFSGNGDQLLIFARQLVMWVILLISPTPGGSGVAEMSFDGFFYQFVDGGMVNAVALIWRMLTYYSYIILGLLVLPYWFRRVQKYHISKKRNIVVSEEHF